jgi:hypothetical protein
MSEQTHIGKCFCGAVEISVTGKPEAMGFCHCASCRSWGAAPVNAFTLWKPENVKVTKGAEHVATYHKTDKSHRKFCRTCGGHIMAAHPLWNLVDVFSATLPGLKFEPQVHVNYGEKVLAIRDGLPKQNDFPKEMGGSGTLLAE